MPWVPGLDPGQALDAGRKVIVRIGPIHQPPAFARSIAGGVSPAPVVLRQIGIFQADEMELGLGGKRRPGAFIVFLNPESLGQCSDGNQQQGGQNENNARRRTAPELKPEGHSCP